MIKNWKSTPQEFLQGWYLALLNIWSIQGTQSLPLALSQKGKSVPSGHNNDDYIDDKGYYNIMKLFDDH